MWLRSPPLFFCLFFHNLEVTYCRACTSLYIFGTMHCWASREKKAWKHSFKNSSGHSCRSTLSVPCVQINESRVLLCEVKPVSTPHRSHGSICQSLQPEINHNTSTPLWDLVSYREFLSPPCMPGKENATFFYYQRFSVWWQNHSDFFLKIKIWIINVLTFGGKKE